jgi:predicted phosphodiesterase
MYTFKNILVCGDIHGVYDVIPKFIKKNGLNNCVVIVAGDFGIGFETPQKEINRLKYLSERLSFSNSFVFALRGNHDDPSYFDGNHNIVDNVILVKDYDIFNINGLNILCIGGAVSVDRYNRKPFFTGKGRGYWKDEIFIYDHDKVMALKNIDIVVTHSSPDFCYPYLKGSLKNWAIVDKKLYNDVGLERSQLTQLYYGLVENGNILKHWYYGHFHASNNMPYKETMFSALDINEIVDLKY